MASTVRAIYKDLSGKGRTQVMTGEGIETPPSPSHDDIKGIEKITESQGLHFSLLIMYVIVDQFIPNQKLSFLVDTTGVKQHHSSALKYPDYGPCRYTEYDTGLQFGLTFNQDQASQQVVI